MELIRKAIAQTYSTGGLEEGAVPFEDIGTLLSSVLQVIFFGAGLAAFVYLIIGGIQYITSGGEKDKVEDAQKKITYAVIGLVVVVAVYAIVRILETVLGIPIISGFTFTFKGATTVGGLGE